MGRSLEAGGHARRVASCCCQGSNVKCHCEQGIRPVEVGRAAGNDRECSSKREVSICSVLWDVTKSTGVRRWRLG